MMRNPRPILMALLLAASVALGPVTATAQDGEPAPEFSKEFRKKAGPVQKSVTAKDWAAVLAALPSLEALEGLTPDDRRVIASWKLTATQAAGSREEFAATIEQYMADGYASPEQIGPMHQQLAAFYSSKQDMARTLHHYRLFVDHTPDADPSEFETLGRLYLQQDHFAEAASWLGRAIDETRKTGGTPKELWYQLRDRCFVETGEMDKRLANLEALTRHYPDREYYSRIISIYAKSTNDDRAVMLNIFRLALADAGLATVGEYLAYADTALVAGSPGEAQRALEHGMAAGIVPAAGTNEVALRDARAAVALDRKNLPADAVSAGKNPKGDVDVKVALGFFSMGDHQKTVELVRRGLAKGGVKGVDEANLLLGAALYELKRYGEAREAFMAAEAAPGAGPYLTRIARLWQGMIDRRSAPAAAPPAGAEATG